MNVLKPNLRISVQTLLDAGKSRREIERVLGVDRKTIRRTQQQSKFPGVATGNCAGKTAETAAASEQNPPPRPPALRPVATPSACELHREWIESQVALGRNATSIYQDLSERFGLTHQYTSADIALAAVVHSLATRCFTAYERGHSIQISGNASYYRQESDGANALERAQEAWAERIPGDGQCWKSVDSSCDFELPPKHHLRTERLKTKGFVRFSTTDYVGELYARIIPRTRNLAAFERRHAHSSIAK